MKSKKVPLLIGLSVLALVCCAPFTAMGFLIDGKNAPSTVVGTDSRPLPLSACSKVLDGGKTPNANNLECMGGPGRCNESQ